MTPEDRDVMRAEAAMRILAAMNTNAIVTSVEERNPEIVRRLKEQRVLRVRRAIAEANELIEELQALEEFDPEKPTIAGLVADGIARGGQIIMCKHGRASYEPCPDCDAEDAAARGAKTPEPA